MFPDITCQLQVDICELISLIEKFPKKTKKFSGSFQTELSPTDLANMCGIPLKLHTPVIVQFSTEKCARINMDKIFIPDCAELLKQAAFYRKMSATGDKKNSL